MSEEALSPDTALVFEAFRIDRRVGLSRLHENGRHESVALGSRALAVLRALAERRGDLVTKQELMDAAWPGMVVEDSNLTVQMSALRRILNEGRVGDSCIQTVIGRGYRLLPPVTTDPDPPVPDRSVPPPKFAEARAAPGALHDMPAAKSTGKSSARPHRRSRFLMAAVAALIVIGAGLGAVITWRSDTGQTTRMAAPRLSMVVLPFQNLSGNPAEDYLADGITDDLTTDLSHISEAFVIARESAYSYKNKSADVRRIGRELGVRYVLEGSMRKLGTTLRVNVQLTSAETGLHLWADRFDEDLKDLAEGQQNVVARMRGALRINIVDVERISGLRERPSNPDAFDLILRARALRNQLVTTARRAEAMALYEQALVLDPGSHLAMAGAARLRIDQFMDQGYWASIDDKERSEALTAKAMELAPLSQDVLIARAFLFRAQSRWRDAIVAAEQLIDLFPNHVAGYVLLGVCRTLTGDAADEIALNEKLLRISPRDPYRWNHYRRMGYASLLLGRDRDAIALLDQALALHPEMTGFTRQWVLRQMAVAHARLGQEEQARRAIVEADRLWPFNTVRNPLYGDFTRPAYAEQTRAYQEGLRRAGVRDHADENADFGLSPDNTPRQDLAGLTPTTVPGARTILTSDLVPFLADRKPVIIDTTLNFRGRSIPGAVALEHSGLGGALSETTRDRLRRKMEELTGGDPNKPIVAVGWNSERFDSRNLVLRLIALGYTNVYWYRGGREAWEVADLPEAELTLSEW